MIHHINQVDIWWVMNWLQPAMTVQFFYIVFTSFSQSVFILILLCLCLSSGLTVLECFHFLSGEKNAFDTDLVMVLPVVMYWCESWTINSWALKNWCFWTVLLEKTLETPLDYKEIQPVHPKGDQSWIFIGRTDAEAETPILWLPDSKNWLIWKDPDAGKDWRREETGTTEDEMVGCHHWLDGHEFEQAPGVGDGQGGLACCSPWGQKELDTTEWLNWIELAMPFWG